ncbi:MAG: hypothetical protein KDD11_08585 [Acidobacteria bacterium]|nr:hypothetical protein [Acidobacteriota bacterium]
MTGLPPVAAITRFLDDPTSGDFDELALVAFEFQYRRIDAYRRLCDARGATPATVRRWQDVPAVPASAFKTLPLAAAPSRRAFRSSGTTAGPRRRSVHYQPFPQLYESAVDASFPVFCLPATLTAGGTPPMLSLIPTSRQVPDSSLSFMIDRVLARWGGADSATAFGLSGVDTAAATAWAKERAAGERPVLVLATALALLQWLERLRADRLHLALPAGSVVFETGGFKGREREVTRAELLALLEEGLAVPPERVVREYGMTELSSQFYTRSLTGGDPDLFFGPPWTRVRLLEPRSLEPCAPGEPGLVAVFDLANLGSAVHVLTEDLGVAEPVPSTPTASSAGFRLLGRAAGAELRGCSLTAEELARS